MFKKGNEKGFTLIEMMAVVAVTSILAGIAIPNFVDYRRKACNVSAFKDAKEAFVASQAHFNDNPTGSISSVDDLTTYGFSPTQLVNVAVNGNVDSLQITTYHDAGDRTYVLNHEGTLQS